MRLDDFYKDLDAPDLPRSEELGMVDWDHPDSWDEPAAVAAMSTLLATGTAVMPIYDISVSRATGEHAVTARPDDLVVAEGIFAAEAIPALREAGLLHSAWCMRHHRLKTFVLRLARDPALRARHVALLPPAPPDAPVATRLPAIVAETPGALFVKIATTAPRPPSRPWPAPCARRSKPTPEWRASCPRPREPCRCASP